MEGQKEESITLETMADGGGRARWKPQKLTMEEYLFFVDTNKVDLPVDQLNQIIDFHGYKKLHKTHKRIMCEAVSTMELMKPSRSTLQDDDVSSCAMISLDDVIKDLKDLNWQECCVTSLQMLNSVDLQPQHNHLNSIASDPSGSTAKKRGRPRNRLRKLMIDNVSRNNNSNASCGIDGDHVDAASHGLGSGDSRSAWCSSVIRRGGRGGDRATKLTPKRKRSVRRGGAGGSAMVSFGSSEN